MEPPSTAPKYTTVGSIYNPSSTPLKPPTRRGRTVKWPLQADVAAPKSPMFGLSLTAQSPSASAADQPLRYSPLQQNYDRAISPAASLDSLALTPTPQIAPFADMYGNGSFDPHPLSNDEDDAHPRGDEEDTEDEKDGSDNLTKDMSVKTLTNLASYENPMKKVAQKLLSRARTLPPPPARPREDQSDRSELASLLDGASDPEICTSKFRSILARGPGAPQPLTAGPPGFRQKSTTADPLALPQMPPPKPLRAVAGHPQYYTPEAAAVAMRPQLPSLVLSTSDIDAGLAKMGDTLTAQEAVRYYANGLPANFNYTTIQDSGIPPLTQPRRDLEKHRQKVNALWCAGNNVFSKTMDVAIAEKNRRDFEKVMGIPREEERVHEDRGVVRKISVQEASARPTREHAAPLLRMAFQTLINHPDFPLFMDQPMPKEVQTQRGHHIG